MKKIGSRLLGLLVGAMLALVMFFQLTLVADDVVHFEGIGVNAQEFPEIPPQDQEAIDRASASRAGVELRKQAYEPTYEVSEEGVVEFFDDNYKAKVGGGAYGPYVRFSRTTEVADRYGPEVPPDVVVDSAQGVPVGLIQYYSNERGAACYTDGDVRQMQRHWVDINAYLWRKSLNQSFRVSSTDVPAIPKGTIFPCYVY